MRKSFELYDSIAERYQRVVAPGLFTRVARDLVALMPLRTGARALDVGAGTGVVAAAMREAVGPIAFVCAVDLSIPMLQQIEGRIEPVAGEVPGLPFKDASFDAVAASFVLTHVSDCAAAMRDMVRVAREDGVVAITCWEDHPNEVDALWGEVAGRFVDREAMAKAVKHSRGSQQWLADAGNVRQLLRSSGLEVLHMETRPYEVECAVEEDLEHRAVLLSGRYLREHLPPSEWVSFSEEVAAAIRRRFGDRVRLERPAHLAVGRLVRPV